jgi:hypothetical protein
MIGSDRGTSDARGRKVVMKRIVEIVPARPGWYTRWRLASDTTHCHPVTLWALTEDTDGTREVVGMDAFGQWPGGDDDETVGEFVRYFFQQPESGQPADVEPPTPDDFHPTGPRLQPVTAT